MTYSGTVRRGRIVLEDAVRIPDGTRVRITPVSPEPRRPGHLPAFGLWRDRDDLDDPVRAARELRRRVERRGDRG